MPYEPLKIRTEKPVLSWADHELGSAEIKMAKNVASLPFVYKHVALMPDVHLGKGALVGSVIATEDAVIPAAVGVDIGCGMAAIKTPYKAEQLEGKLKQIRSEIEATIPVGFDENKEADKTVTNWQNWRDFKDLHKGVQKLESKALKQMGSLGGGNHFIEVCLDTEDQIWLMLHSGSRHIGNKLAQCHIGTAKELAKLASLSLPDPDLAYFVAGTDEFVAYWHDLQWAQNYARFNRDVMMQRFKQIIDKYLAGGKPNKPLLSVNCHHNYAEKELHFGQEVYVTRKGAVRAREEDYGIIPGSMGAKSYIVKGKGNHDSYCSCFPAKTLILTDQGLMNIEDVFNSSTAVKLISYDQESQTFIPKKIIDKSVRNALVNQYSLSQTRRRLENTICCTPDHPFATYNRGELVYDSIERIANNQSGVIIPTQISLPSNLSFEEQDQNFYYLLGLILSDGTIHLNKRANAPDTNQRPREGKYLQSYIHIFQANKPEKKEFINHIETLLKIYSDKVSIRIISPEKSDVQDQIIAEKGWIELTISDLDFVNRVNKTLSNLSNILLTNPWLALHFLAGYLDGDGSYNRYTISISVVKREIFSPLVCIFLSLGVAYKVYRNRDHYVIEFRDNVIINKLREICKRLQIQELSKRFYSDRLLLAKTMIDGESKCENLTTMAKQEKMVSVHKFEGQLDKTLAMNRVFDLETVGKTRVYNFTVEDNHNYIVFTDFYTPVLVHNCSHGAGRLMSRTQAKKQFTLDDLISQTEGVECRKDRGVLDEIPGAYKPIETVINQQSDLVEVVATLKQVLCVKG
ncbi:UPF0027-containing protein [Crocosphaera subtropica ATCC 51142]|uniref:3'-phosphate/5'-hydroxy nucleic acid ligase n=1 Tax=Crocosphaera subtropica (strain ATCC 51142 / BH68) TaxID=43989 RepID=B1WU47_CROS5|nr:UPF0027-containing protein [Crocosphaera subtropica ATCC 51142]